MVGYRAGCAEACATVHRYFREPALFSQVGGRGVQARDDMYHPQPGNLVCWRVEFSAQSAKGTGANAPAFVFLFHGRSHPDMPQNARENALHVCKPILSTAGRVQVLERNAYGNISSTSPIVAIFVERGPLRAFRHVLEKEAPKFHPRGVTS